MNTMLLYNTTILLQYNLTIITLSKHTNYYGYGTQFIENIRTLL